MKDISVKILDWNVSGMDLETGRDYYDSFNRRAMWTCVEAEVTSEGKTIRIFLQPTFYVDKYGITCGDLANPDSQDDLLIYKSAQGFWRTKYSDTDLSEQNITDETVDIFYEDVYDDGDYLLKSEISEMLRDYIDEHIDDAFDGQEIDGEIWHKNEE